MHWKKDYRNRQYYVCVLNYIHIFTAAKAWAESLEDGDIKRRNKYTEESIMVRGLMRTL